MFTIEGVNPALNIVGKQIMELSKGNFDYKANVLSDDDDINLIVSGLNMLSEEIKDITYSQKFFDNIFNSSPDVIFVVNETGQIKLQNT